MLDVVLPTSQRELARKHVTKPCQCNVSSTNIAEPTFQAQPLTVEPSPPVAAMPKAVPPPDASPEVNSTKPKKIENQHVYRATAVHITHNDPFSNGNTRLV